MPVLRLEPDNSLAETLGGLGSALGQALNPMNQIRANDMLAQMQQRQWEIAHAKALDAANQNAANVFANSDLPFDPATKAAIAAGLRNGTLNANNYIDALKATGGMKANQDAADMYRAAHSDLPPAELSSDVAELIAGRKTASELDAQRSTTKLTTAKTDAALGAQSAVTSAVTPDMQPETKAVVGSLALSDPTAAQTTLNKQRTLTGAGALPQGIAIDDPRITQQNVLAELGGLTPVPIAQAAPAQAIADITKQSLIEQAKPRAPTEIVPPIAPVNPLTGQPPKPGEAGFSQSASGPDTGATSASAAAQTSGEAVSKYANATLQGGIEEGQGAQTVLNDVNQLRYLASVMNNDGPMNQAQNRIADEMYKRFGLTLTAGQSAREVFNNYVAALMGSWRKDVGIQRLALPEIQLGQLSLPNPNMSLDALNSALDFVQARAQISDKVGQAALRYLTDTSRPIEQRANEFLAERNKYYAPEANPAATIKQERIDKNTVNSPTGPKHYRIVNGQRVEIPNP